MAYLKLTQEMAGRAVAKTDWAAQDAPTDEEITRQVAQNSDAAPILYFRFLIVVEFGRKKDGSPRKGSRFATVPARIGHFY